ncbi:MAG: response regulator transcription factor [Gemmataceae bacterium]|nr:response regulator transcription factor [Gemmataceae bacterium]
MTARIVVVEDEPAIRRGVVDVLRVSGYQVDEAADGKTGLDLSTSSPVDLVLLDLLLPQMDGLEVLRGIRKKQPTLPVIILTARGSEDDRVRGLRLGADDYVVKPFSAKELLARVEAVLRRSPHRATEVLQARLGHAKLDLKRGEVRWGKESSAELSDTEASLLRYLIQHRERIVTRDELLLWVWGVSPDYLETRTIDMHVARLRAKLRDPSGKTVPDAVVTVRGRGYMASPDLQPAEAPR